MIENIAETGSTNADLLARLAAGEQLGEGNWLIADRQSAGRGRQGRNWAGGAGNFMGSTVVHRAPGDPPAHTLSLVAGIALFETLLPLIPPPPRLQLKWPNDVMVSEAKLSGILLEACGDSVVVGIGVNLALAPDLPDRATIALADLGPPPDRDSFASTLSGHFDAELARWRTYGLEPVLRRWLAAATPVGTALSVHEPGGERLSGTFAGLGEDGSLVLRLADGTRRAIHAGDVMLA